MACEGSTKGLSLLSPVQAVVPAQRVGILLQWPQRCHNIQVSTAALLSEIAGNFVDRSDLILEPKWFIAWYIVILDPRLDYITDLRSDQEPIWDQKVMWFLPRDKSDLLEIS